MLVHAEEVPGKDGGFFSAYAGTDFHNHITIIQGIGRNEEKLKIADERFPLVREILQFFLRLGSQKRIGKQFTDILNLLFHTEESLIFINNGFKGGAFFQTGLITRIVLDDFRLGDGFG